MTRRRLILLPLACLSLLAGCIATPTTETFVWKGPVAKDGWLRFRNSNGDFTIREGTGDSAEISLEIARSNQFAPAAQARVIRESDGSIVACILYSNEGRCSAEDFKSGQSWQKGFLPFMNGNTEVTGTITLPRGVKLDAAGTNGGFEIADITADIVASTTNGDITVTGSRGTVQLSTTNGDLDIVAGTITGKLTASTTNGDVTLTAPETLNAALTMSTVNGDLDFGMSGTVQSQTKRQIIATLGTGGTPVSISTTNGDVTLQKAGSQP
jgi:hypothetical protein